MQLSIQAMRERRSDRAKALHKLLEDNQGENWSADHQAKYDEGMAEIASIDAEMKRHDDLMAKMTDEANAEKLLEKSERIAHDQKDPAAYLFAKWLRRGDNALSAEEWSGIRNVMSTTTGAEGGFTVQTEVAKSIMDALKAYGGMREVAEVFQTAQGNSWAYPTSDGTSEAGEIVAENVSATDADPTFGTVGLDVYKFSSKVVTCPIELLQDSEVDVEAFINGRLITRIGRITNQMFTTGTGTAQPRGVVTAAASGKVGTTGQTTSVIFDDLVDLVHSVDPAYRASGNCRFMMNDASMGVIRKIKDGNGRPVFLPGYDGLGGPMADSLLGYPVQINQDVSVMAANAKSILFGDFMHYKIRDVLQAQMFRFTDSAYAKKGQVGFLMWSRHGGNFVDVGGAVKYYQNSAT